MMQHKDSGAENQIYRIHDYSCAVTNERFLRLGVQYTYDLLVTSVPLDNIQLITDADVGFLFHFCLFLFCACVYVFVLSLLQR